MEARSSIFTTNTANFSANSTFISDSFLISEIAKVTEVCLSEISQEHGSVFLSWSSRFPRRCFSRISRRV